MPVTNPKNLEIYSPFFAKEHVQWSQNVMSVLDLAVDQVERDQMDDAASSTRDHESESTPAEASEQRVEAMEMVGRGPRQGTRPGGILHTSTMDMDITGAGVLGWDDPDDREMAGDTQLSMADDNGTDHLTEGLVTTTVVESDQDISEEQAEIRRHHEEALKSGSLREVGIVGRWTVSSAKNGMGVNNLRDGDLTSFWQSDGVQPHSIDVQFPRRINISMLRFYINYPGDESYTPQRLNIFAGTHFHDLHLVSEIELSEPSGWVSVSMGVNKKGIGHLPLSCHHVQILVLSNHLNGRDTHVRQVEIWGPRRPLNPQVPKFKNEHMRLSCTLR
eukprot:Clim_evm48s203 gene=Clim_evmTU48s203